MIGETIDGRYRVLRVLGRGGMGAVYEAEHTGTGRRVAVKVIHAELAKKPETVLRFQREARAAGAIETPHIVQILDTGTDPASGVVYMVMELLRGEDLEHLIKRLGKLAPLFALRLLGQACTGLGKAHEAGVIHRDIKPANLFLSTSEGGDITVKVVDFGIVKIMGDLNTVGEAGLTGTGGMIGSPRYMSPEQAMGRKTLDTRTDVWSLGVVLYQALAGRVPHDSDTIGELIMAICSEPVPPLQDLAPWVSPEIAQIVHRMLARSPEARFQSVAALLEAILPLVPDGLSVRADALLPLTEATLAEVAPRLVLEEEAVGGPVASIPPGRSLPPPSFAGGEAALSVSQSAARSRVPSRRPLLISALALSFLLGGGLVASRLVGHGAAVAPGSGPAVAVLPSGAPLPAVSLASPAPAAPPSSPAALLSDERTVRLAVEPANVTVEVDGRAVPVNDGGVELRGALGSMHHVRLVKGSRETAGEVVITAVGAVPPRMQIEASAPKRPLKPAVASGSGAPAASPNDTAPATKFE